MNDLFERVTKNHSKLLKQLKEDIPFYCPECLMEGEKVDINDEDERCDYHEEKHRRAYWREPEINNER